MQFTLLHFNKFYQLSLAFAETDWSTNKLCSNKNLPVTAIIAALSVQYSNLGINVSKPSFSRFFKAILKPLFAETPPEMAICRIPVCFDALLSFSIKIINLRRLKIIYLWRLNFRKLWLGEILIQLTLFIFILYWITIPDKVPILNKVNYKKLYLPLNTEVQSYHLHNYYNILDPFLNNYFYKIN